MDFGRVSDIGTRRLENQDALAIFTNENFILLLLCDGMGGHYGGSIASSTTIKVFQQEFDKSLTQYFNSSEVDSYMEWVKNTINKTKKEMIRISDHDEAMMDMGTTVTGALVNLRDKFILFFNVGDSRTYVLTTLGELHQITSDHNYLNQLISEGIPEREARKYRNHVALTSSLGPDKRTKIEFFTVKHDVFNQVYSIISTSDGAHDFVPKPYMEGILKSDNSADIIAKDIVEYALRNNSTDNASCGIVVLDNIAEWRNNGNKI
ncbi:PP2C family protein-serine/threonine phosphatase [Mycoplasma tauri]|uniref:Protein phosphatase 2C domain-containing protein n=1 Tax=Mycoplasma tauri TaxID=547987 RepID=A0A953NCC9_9MOLU|nr:protein phosphatase 2C domain-containing protein [Mycoplasma tauri]MBZ4195267.1 protein phosphatase 2C domain-containing protein [Mycoplasma tauri]MBZ4203906.1 protein phosphatase 2C domain-containing protein [Mycoplasma tauri]MBZ4204170.1 protein phosphatase 2C domain-containing protein [Mycoplasma tauri]MBZ4212568.1 protein phosphatase 2C domain-containing protein [Mycoplasma tauri]MBZ4218200.1 protein phosphatase 2C domain-containing protein [Mycoplasma tauri]